MTNARELSVNALMDICQRELFTNIVMEKYLEEHPDLTGSDKRLFVRLTEGTVERLITLDYVINGFSKTKVNKMKPLIRALLRMSVYQMLYMDRIPDSAACNEAVKIASKRGFHTLRGFVNGVLRNISRQKDQIKWPDRSKDPVLYLSVTYSCPEWIIKGWQQEYDLETIEAMLKAMLSEKPVNVWANETRVSAQDFGGELKDLGSGASLTCRENPYIPGAYLVDGIGGLMESKAFKQGHFYVQDTSSVLGLTLAGIKPGMRVLDVCGSPGGKSLYAAMLMGNQGQVVSRDLTDRKVARIRENANRLGLSCIEAQVWDALKLREEDLEAYDLVIADLPCSGLGVMGRKTDIKYHTKKEDLEELCKLQREILKVVYRYVKPGGTLIYSTCTIGGPENGANAQWISRELPLEPVDIYDSLPEDFRKDTAHQGYVQLLPCDGAYHDGFFISKYIRP